MSRDGHEAYASRLQRLQKLITACAQLEIEMAENALQSSVMARSCISAAREALEDAHKKLQQKESGTFRFPF